MHKKQFVLISLLLIAALQFAFISQSNIVNDKIVAMKVDPKLKHIKLYWKDDKGTILGSLQNLISYTNSKHERLLFAMNGGMYKEDQSPLGLFIQDKKMLSHLNTAAGKGNFYMNPNGVFYLTNDNSARICKTQDFNNTNDVVYATQSGPMLVIDGAINPLFTDDSQNLNIRNGVGILPDNTVVFAMSKQKINFYDFANYFKNLGCKNALYLDGFVSRTYFPDGDWKQTDGDFGVMIGVTDNQ